VGCVDDPRPAPHWLGPASSRGCPAPQMSEWPPGKDGGGAGGAGQKLTLPLPPIQRPLQQQEAEPPGQQPKVLRPAVFSKLENLVREMQDSEHGVPVRSQKLFLTSIPAAFMGYDLIEWLMDRLCIEDSPVEAVHLANLLCQFGYYFPVSEQKNLLVKDDSSLYRFQSPYYWPSQHHTPDNIEYAIYLYKRAQRNKKIHGLEPGLPDYENDALNNLKKILVSKWDFVTMQAEEQLKVAKDRKKGDKIINDSQEKAYWRVYRPPPGYNTLVENSPVPTREQRVKARRNNKELLKEETDYLKQYFHVSRLRTSQVAEGILEYTDTFVDWDPLLVGVGPSNPWMTDDQSYWEINKPIPDVPTEKRVRRWAISLEDIILDPLGVQELLQYMKKEYSHENLRFWLAVQELKRGPGSDTKIKKKVKEIFEEFLSKGAKAEINIDGKTMEETRIAMKTPSRYTYDKAADHVYLLLLKKDCYPRFIRSEHYKNLLAYAINPGSSRKRFFNFPQVRKKISQNHPPHAPGQPGPGGSNVSGPNPEDFEIYGMDGTGEDDDKTPLNPNAETPRKIQPLQDRNEACPWDIPSEPPRHEKVAGRARKISIASGEVLALTDNHVPNSENNASNSVLARPLSLNYIPSDTDQFSTDLGQVEIDLSQDKRGSEASESPNKIYLRKKSSSAISGDDEIIIKKTSKSSPADSLQFNPTLNSSCSALYDSGPLVQIGSGPGVSVCQTLGLDNSHSSLPFQQTQNLSPGKCSDSVRRAASENHGAKLRKEDGECMSGSAAASAGAETDGATAAIGGEEERTEAPPGDAGENGCWITTQDVCPWEDEESCKKESHPPFVKTYATLGYL